MCNKQTLYEVVCYNRNTQPAISFLHLLGAVASLVASLAALVADNLIRTIASKMTRLVAVSADGLVGAVASLVARLTAVAADKLIRAIAGDVTLLVAVTADDDSLSSGGRMVGPSHKATYTHKLLLGAIRRNMTRLAAVVAHRFVLILVSLSAIAS